MDAVDHHLDRGRDRHPGDWGLDSVGWFTTGTGREILGSLISIAVVIAIAVVVWEFTSSAIARYLSSHDVNGDSVERSARIRTLLPLLRNAFLVFLIGVVGLTVMAELGVNIGRCWPAPASSAWPSVSAARRWCATSSPGCSSSSRTRCRSARWSMSAATPASSRPCRSARCAARPVGLGPHRAVERGHQRDQPDQGFLVLCHGHRRRLPRRRRRGDRGIKQIGADLQSDPAYGTHILEPLEVMGVDSFGDNAVVIKARIKTYPIKQWFVGREFNRRMKRRFDELGIEIPFPHRTIYFGEDKQGGAPPARVQIGSAGDNGKTAAPKTGAGKASAKRPPQRAKG
jgi:moderate conductance mechanosensitive channel